MAKGIGLDIGSRTVKLVELDGSPKKFRVTKYVSREIPGEGGSAAGAIVSETIAEVLRDAKAAKDTLVAAMDSGAVVIREILIAFLQDDQIRRVLRYEAEAHLHNFAIEDVVVDYLKIGEMQDQSKILVFAAPKDRVRDRLASLNGAGVDPMHLGLDLIALYNAARATGAFERHANSVVLDVGATNTKILFVLDGKLKSVRSLRTGSESITRVLAQDLMVDTDSAREMSSRGEDRPREDDLLTPLTLPDDEEEEPETGKSASQLENAIVRQRHDDFLVRLHRETTRSFASFAAGAEPEAIYLTGGASLTGGMKERLEERFGKPVIRLDFLGDGNHNVPAADHDRANAQMGVALGCALRSLGDEDVSLEFRKDELRYTRKFDQIKVTLASTVTLIFLLLFLTALKVTGETRDTRRTLQEGLRWMSSTYVEPTKKQYSTVLDDQAKKLPADTMVLHLALPTWLSQLNVMDRHITNEMGFDVRDIPPIRSSLVIWNDVFEKLSGTTRDTLGYLNVDYIEMKQKTVELRGLIGDRINVDKMREEIAKIPYVEKVEQGLSEQDKKTGKDKFRVTATLVPTTVEKN